MISARMIVLLGAVCCVTASGCLGPARESPIRKIHEEKLLLGTFVQVDICASSEDSDLVRQALDQVWARLQEIQERMNRHDLSSDVAGINSSGGEFVRVHSDVFYVLREAVRLSEATQGVFDVTVGPLIALWRQAAQDNRLPDEDLLRAVRTRVGFQHIIFGDNNQIRLDCQDCLLDLGGIAKGYAVDEAVRILRSARLPNFLIDAGGDMFAGGVNCSGLPWRIGVRHPGRHSTLIDIVEVSDQSVTTSGDYEQFHEIQGERWSHIVNPLTGYPQRGVVSATVIAPCALEADVLSTTLCLWPPDDGIGFVENLGESYGAFLVEGDSESEFKFHSSSVYSSRSYGIYRKEAK